MSRLHDGTLPPARASVCDGGIGAAGGATDAAQGCKNSNLTGQRHGSSSKLSFWSAILG